LQHFNEAQNFLRITAHNRPHKCDVWSCSYNTLYTDHKTTSVFETLWSHWYWHRQVTPLPKPSSR